MTWRTKRTPADPAARFDRKVDFDSPDGCWLWTGARRKSGYAQFQVGGRGSAQPLVHRWNYERHVGPIPDGWQIDHLCKVRHCVNPAHLEAVPPRVNNARSASPSAENARLVYCQRGLHLLEGENLMACYLVRGQRVCRLCRNEQARLYRARSKPQMSN